MGRLAGCPVEGGCVPGSRVLGGELCTGAPPEEELPEETPCLETEPAKGLFLYTGPAGLAACCLAEWLRAVEVAGVF